MLASHDDVERAKAIPATKDQTEEKSRLTYIRWTEKIVAGKPFLEPHNHNAQFSAYNLHLSQCFVCHDFSVWLNNQLIYPAGQMGPMPNDDLPGDIRRDYEEARAVLNASPRAAAALLRLCIQKLCIVLGEKGNKIDDDIASLVVKGLSPVVQRSLDIVRVIGNESVHPGEMDLRDDRDTATALFGLVNSIVDSMISHPKNVDALYGTLSPNKRAAIEERDAKAKAKAEKQ